MVLTWVVVGVVCLITVGWVSDVVIQHCVCNSAAVIFDADIAVNICIVKNMLCLKNNCK